jgi:hypothetical protein
MRLLILISMLFQEAQIFQPTGRFKAKPVLIEPVPSVKVEAPKKRSQPWLAMWTGSYCGPCRTWKRTVKPQLERLGYNVREYEMTDPVIQATYGHRIKSIPAFQAFDPDTGDLLTDVKIGGITVDEAIAMLIREESDTASRMLDGSSLQSTKVPLAPKAKPVQHGVVPIDERALSPRVTLPARYIQWPGWGTIDLDTYNRNCNCNMCNSIRGMQQEYRRQMNSIGPQSSLERVSPDQEGTPYELVETMLDLMDLHASDTLVDLGCGDGRVLIAAGRRGIRSIGVELDEARAEIARRNVNDSGFADLITVETGDALNFDLKRATIAVTYLYPPLLAKLAPKLKQLRVVGSPYHEIPGLPMTQDGDVWIYKHGANHEEVVANNAVGVFRGNRVADWAGSDAAR